MIKGNRGEWSELYVLFRLLADGKLYAADEHLNRIDFMFFPILKIIREETLGKKKEFYTGKTIQVCINGVSTATVPVERFLEESEHLLLTIQESKTTSFSSDQTEEFMKMICVDCLESRGRDKADIFIEIHDIQTVYELEVGFSIKSKLGKSATLLNAGKTTNFIYELTGSAETLRYISEHLLEVQGVTIPDADNKANGIGSILENLSKLNCPIKFHSADERFCDNLMMIDSQMPCLIAELLLAYYAKCAQNTMLHITEYVSSKNPLAVKEEKATFFYFHKIKTLLAAVALGMTPSVEWNGSDKATGGYIIVKQDGEIVAYHIYNRDKFKDYLLTNTRFESASRSRHDFGYIYQENARLFIKLNLQIRFQ